MNYDKTSTTDTKPTSADAKCTAAYSAITTTRGTGTVAFSANKQSRH